MPFRSPIHRIPHIRTPTNHAKQHNFYKQPPPPTTLPSSIRIIAPPLWFAPFVLGAFDRLAAVEVVCLDRDDVEVVAQFAGLGAEAEVGDRGDGDGAVLEAEGPQVVGLVLEFEFEGLVLEVGEAGFGGDGCASDTACLGRGQSPSRDRFKAPASLEKHTEQPANSVSLPSFPLL